MKKSYLIYSPPYDHSSAGIKVLHRLAVELQKRGENVFINTVIQNKKWPIVPYFDKVDIEKKEPILQNAIAIYPDIIHDNNFNAKTVVRWMLNIPEYSGGPPIDTYPKTDIFYTYSRLFNTRLGLPDDRVLLCPSIDLSVFYDMHIPRSGRLVYRGKGQQPDNPLLAQYPSLGGKESFKGDDGQNRLRERLNKTEMLYVYDNATAITDIARLCGCPTVIVPDGLYSRKDYEQHELWHAGGIGYDLIEAPIARATIDSEYMAKYYAELEAKFQERLSEMIELTQEA
jgi:hypothetical protein